MRTSHKLQSAMEYLMTYGWAILIIAVVLGALFSLGVFNSGALLGTHCIATPGFTCTSPQMIPNGNFMATIGQATGTQITVQGLACSSSATSSGLPQYGGNTLAVGGNILVLVNGVNTLNSNTIAVGSTFTISVPCFSAATLSTYKIGDTFTGTVWINYTVPGSTTPIITPLTSSLSVKVT